MANLGTEAETSTMAYSSLPIQRQSTSDAQKRGLEKSEARGGLPPPPRDTWILFLVGAGGEGMLGPLEPTTTVFKCVLSSRLPSPPMPQHRARPPLWIPYNRPTPGCNITQVRTGTQVRPSPLLQTRLPLRKLTPFPLPRFLPQLPILQPTDWSAPPFPSSPLPSSPSRRPPSREKVRLGSGAPLPHSPLLPRSSQRSSQLQNASGNQEAEMITLGLQ